MVMVEASLLHVNMYGWYGWLCSSSSWPDSVLLQLAGWPLGQQEALHVCMHA